MAASFIRCEDASLLAEVLASAVAEPLALRALAPTVAISQAPLREVLTELRAAGFAPAGEDSSGTLVDLRPRGGTCTQPSQPTGVEDAGEPPSADQLASLVRTMRAGDRASAPPGRGGVRTDGSRENNAATIALLATAARDNSSVNIGYVDAQGGVATHRIVDPRQRGRRTAGRLRPRERRGSPFHVAPNYFRQPPRRLRKKVAKKKQLAFFCK